MEISIARRGPFFHQRHQLMTELELGLIGTVAGAAEQAVQANLAGSLRHPTGSYQGHVVIDRSFPDRALVTDQGVVYGPWLEGVSSRNQSARFKGYASFRRAAQLVERTVPELCESLLALTVRRFNR